MSGSLSAFGVTFAIARELLQGRGWPRMYEEMVRSLQRLRERLRENEHGEQRKEVYLKATTVRNLHGECLSSPSAD